jgi:uncharacterized FAD-dependent dehydrogenase
MGYWDVIIVGAGPAGIFAALELARISPSLSVLVLEKGHDLERRSCPREGAMGGCVNCTPCSVTSGWGGAGAFSDGKLTLTPRFGGFLNEFLSQEEISRLIDYVDDIWREFGAADRLFGTDEAAVRELAARATRAGLDLIPARIRHLGTERCPAILRAMYDYLKPRATIRTLCKVERLLARDGRIEGVVLADGSVERCKFLIAAPGREGSAWFSEQASALGLDTANNPVDIGVRVEVPAVIAEEVTEKVWEPKIHYYSRAFDDLVRTFCVCPHGEVVTENSGGVVTVNGHSWSDKRTQNTNFALLVSKMFTEPFKEPIAYGKYIASLANMLGGGVIVQRLGDLWEGRRSTDKRIRKSMVEPTLKSATPGDLTLVLPYRHIRNILEMLEALDKIMPGIWSRNTLLYGVEVKFYSSRVNVGRYMETEIDGLYAVGDGAGITRSLAQASASGVQAARSIAARAHASG